MDKNKAATAKITHEQEKTMFHPPAEQIRQTISDFKPNNPMPAVHHSSCACCQGPKPKSDFKEIKVIALVAFAVTLGLVAINAHQRDKIEHEDTVAQYIPARMSPVLSPLDTNLGPGATQAAELSFPTKTPTQQNMYYTPVQQQALIQPMQIRPSEPALQIMAMPVHDGKGGIVHRLKRVVSR